MKWRWAMFRFGLEPAAVSEWCYRCSCIYLACGAFSSRQPAVLRACVPSVAYSLRCRQWQTACDASSGRQQCRGCMCVVSWQVQAMVEQKRLLGAARRVWDTLKWHCVYGWPIQILHLPANSCIWPNMVLLKNVYISSSSSYSITPYLL